MTKFLGWTKFWPLIQPFLFWKGETIKGIPENLPISDVIAQLKDPPSSGLRGVTRSNHVNPSDASLPSENYAPDHTYHAPVLLPTIGPSSPNGSKTQNNSEPPILGPPEPLIPSDSPQEPHVLYSDSVTESSDSVTESSTWTIVPSRNSTQKRNKPVYTNKRVDNSTKHIY